MTHRLNIRKASLVAVIALIAAACGSTVPTSTQQAAEDAAEEGLAVEDGGVGGLGGGSDFDSGGLAEGSAGSGGTALGDSGSGGLGGGTGGAGGSGGSIGGGSGVDSPAHGVTASTITLGLPVVEDISAGNQALTGGNAATGIDYKRAWETIVKDINEGGGIGGHKVKPVYHRSSAVSQKTSDQVAQEACTNWTQDHEVFAALAGYETENFHVCMEKAGAAIISGTSIRSYFDERFFPRYPHTIVPFGADLNSQADALVNGLVKMGFFEKEAKLGLLTFDDPSFVHATQQNLIPALRRRGLELTDWVRLHRPRSYGEYGQFSSEANNAAVRFKSEGITHVMTLDIGANIAFFFMQAAEKQQYRPRYGLTSQSGGSALADLLGGDADAQLAGARSIGWAPAIDLHAEDDPNSEANAPRKRCLKLMRKAGVEMSSRNAEGIAMTLCDQMWFTEAALEAGGRTITLDSLLAGVDRLGTSYVSAITPFGTSVSDSRHDGLGAVADMSYIAKCNCFRYTSKPYAIPN